MRLERSLLTAKQTVLYVIVVSGFFGILLIPIDLGVFSLFGYRILIALFWFWLIIDLFLRRGKLKLGKLYVKSYLAFLIIWVFYAILSLSWAVDKTAAIRDIIFLVMGVSIILFVVYYLNALEDLKRFYYLWLIILVLLVALGLWENVTGQHLTISDVSRLPTRLSFIPTGTFNNPNDFATYLTLSFPLAFSVVLCSRKIIARFVGLVLVLATIYLLIMTLSRANYLALAFELVFIFVFMLRIRDKLKLVLSAGIMILILITMFPGVFSGVTGTVAEQMNSLISDLPIESSSLNKRVNLAKNSLYFLFSHFGIGIGAGNDGYYMVHFPIYQTWGKTEVHNWWVENLSNYGIFIFSGYVIFWVSLICNLYKMRGRLKNRVERMICEGLIVGLVGFAFASISSSSIMAFKPQWFFFAFALGFLNYYRRVRYDREKTEKKSMCD